MKKFKKVDPKQPLAELEREVFDFWVKNDTINKSFVKRSDQKEFVFFDGPPFATGLPHYGHLVASAIKDTTARYWTMHDYYVDRRFGWDTHGLPIEMLAEKTLGLSGPADIKKYGVDKFNEFCRANVLKFTNEWEKTILQFGRWADFRNDYKTMDPFFMESVWWTFKQLFDKGLVYKGHKVMPYSSRLSTPLSNFEAGQDYREVTDKSAYVGFKLVLEDAYLLIWTTTPWTLPANMAIAVNPDLEYSLVQRNTKKYYVASTAVKSLFGEEVQVLKTVWGHELVNQKYVSWFPHKIENPATAYRVYPANWVDASSGTGLVHLAPAFGADDYDVCKKYNVDLFDHTDAEGKFVCSDNDLNGKHFTDTNDIILDKLKADGLLFRTAKVTHRYPYCWRSGTPLMYKAVDVYFIAVESFKDRLIEANKKVNWHPEFVGNARFANWLSETKDWAVSRNRFWGTPMPLWTSDDGDTVCIGSVKELESYVGTKVDDLHPHKIDNLSFMKDGKLYKRVPEVFDCWFESGAMPFAQNHYPFNGSEQNLVADFIAEGLDQTRGWFYTLLVLGVALNNEAPYKNVVVNGIVLDKNGEKMSKSKGNYTPVDDLLNKAGADAVRLHLLGSSVTAAHDLKFDDENVNELHRTFFIPLRNAHAFFAQYADGADFDYVKPTNLSIMDKWLLSNFHKLRNDVSNAIGSYNYAEAVRAITSFVNTLNNKYIRNSRSRFWQSELNNDKKAALYTLHYVLMEYSKILAPFAPFFAEHLYQNLALEPKQSVHEERWPEHNDIDTDLLNTFDLGFTVVELGRTIRERAQVPLKQPLKSISIFSLHGTKIDHVTDLIKSELNVKEVKMLAVPDEICSVKMKPDFKELGKAFRKDTQQYATQVEALVWGQPLPEWLKDGMYKLQFQFVDRTASVADSSTAIYLDLTITDDMRREAFLDVFASDIQSIRKRADLDIFEKCTIRYFGNVALSNSETVELERVLRCYLLKDENVKGIRSSLNKLYIDFSFERV